MTHVKQNRADHTVARSAAPPRFGPSGTPAGTGSGPRFSMRWIVSAVAVALTGAAVLGVGLVQERATRQALTEELEARLVLEARNLSLASSSALLNDFPELTLHPLLKEKQERNPEFSLLVVLDHEDRIQGHPEFRRLGEILTIEESFVPKASSQTLGPGETFLANEQLLVVCAPVEYQNQRIGTSAVGIERNYIDHILRQARLRLLAIVGGFLGLAVVVSFFTMKTLLSPIDDLRRGLEQIGRGDLDHAIEVRGRTELGALADTVNTMAAELKVAQAEMVEKERLSHELELAREIQSRLLPHTERRSNGWVVAGSHRAAFEVGGDYFDYFELSGGRTGIVVADVAGKGLAGCLVMSMLAVLLKAHRDRYDSPKELLVKLDEGLAQDLKPGSFVTMFYGILHESTGEFRFASAGHMPTLIRRAATGTVEEHRSRGIPLGAVRGGVVAKTLHDELVRLEPGDLLIQYTDGINESHDAAGQEEFEIHRMTSLLEAHPQSTASETVTLFTETLETWRGGKAREDDETMVVLVGEAPGEAKARPPRVLSFPVDRSASSKGPDSRATADDPDRRSPTRWLEIAEQVGEHLALSTTEEAVDVLGPWLQNQLEFSDLAAGHLELLSTALHEACANVGEHGYGRQEAEFDLWWVPSVDLRQGDLIGRFVLRDRGKSFAPEGWSASDFHDPIVRRRTRGFGLDIIHTVMSSVEYAPSTPQGNIMVLTFDPTAIDMKEARHG